MFSNNQSKLCLLCYLNLDLILFQKLFTINYITFWCTNFFLYHDHDHYLEKLSWYFHKIIPLVTIWYLNYSKSYQKWQTVSSLVISKTFKPFLSSKTWNAFTVFLGLGSIFEHISKWSSDILKYFIKPNKLHLLTTLWILSYESLF